VRKGFFNAGVLIGESGSLFEKYRRDSGQADKPHEVLMAELAADKSHPAWSVLDAMAFRVKAALEKLRGAGLAGDPVEMVVSGGQAKSPLWNAIKAEKTGAVILVPEIPDGELTGDAVLGSLYLEAAGGRSGAAPGGGPSGAFPAPNRRGEVFLEPEKLKKCARRLVRIKERYGPPGPDSAPSCPQAPEIPRPLR
jgi:sugar (pentulose or hexulose) kinase